MAFRGGLSLENDPRFAKRTGFRKDLEAEQPQFKEFRINSKQLCKYPNVESFVEQKVSKALGREDEVLNELVMDSLRSHDPFDPYHLIETLEPFIGKLLSVEFASELCDFLMNYKETPSLPVKLGQKISLSTSSNLKTYQNESRNPSEITSKREEESRNPSRGRDNHQSRRRRRSPDRHHHHRHRSDRHEERSGHRKRLDSTDDEKSSISTDDRKRRHRKHESRKKTHKEHENWRSRHRDKGSDDDGSSQVSSKSSRSSGYRKKRDSRSHRRGRSVSRH